MTARDAILSKVRKALGADDTRERRTAIEARLAARERHLIPARAATGDSAELVTVLRRWLELAGAEMVEAPDEREVPHLVAETLRRHNLPASLRTGADPWLASLPWSTVPALQIGHGRAEASDHVGLTHALAAVAESGTLVVPSGAANPVTLSFLPEANIVLVRRGDVVGPLEDAWVKVRDAGSGTSPALPRTVNLISGPSRSADIGGIPVLGAHGPRHLCVVVVG